MLSGRLSRARVPSEATELSLGSGRPLGMGSEFRGLSVDWPLVRCGIAGDAGAVAGAGGAGAAGGMEVAVGLEVACRPLAVGSWA